MNGYQYESKCAQLLRNEGYTNVEVTPGSGDQGIDIIAHKDGKKYGIQCKYYEGSVGNKAVQEVYAGAAYYDCDVAMVITNATLTAPAQTLATKLGVKIREEVDAIYLMEHDKALQERKKQPQTADDIKAKIHKRLLEIKDESRKERLEHGYMEDREKDALADIEFDKHAPQSFQQWKDAYTTTTLPFVERISSELEALELHTQQTLEDYSKKRNELEQQLKTLLSESEALRVQLNSPILFSAIFKKETLTPPINDQDERASSEGNREKTPLHILRHWKEKHSAPLPPLLEHACSELETLEQRWKSSLENLDIKRNDLEQRLLTLNAESETLSKTLVSQSLFATIFKRKTIKQLQDQLDNTRSAIENCSCDIRMAQEAHDRELTDINTAIENFSNKTLKSLDAYVKNYSCDIRKQLEACVEACEKAKTAAKDRLHQAVIGNASWPELPDQLSEVYEGLLWQQIDESPVYQTALQNAANTSKEDPYDIKWREELKQAVWLKFCSHGLCIPAAEFLQAIFERDSADDNTDSKDWRLYYSDFKKYYGGDPSKLANAMKDAGLLREVVKDSQVCYTADDLMRYFSLKKDAFSTMANYTQDDLHLSYYDFKHCYDLPAPIRIKYHAKYGTICWILDTIKACCWTLWRKPTIQEIINNLPSVFQFEEIEGMVHELTTAGVLREIKDNDSPFYTCTWSIYPGDKNWTDEEWITYYNERSCFN